MRVKQIRLIRAGKTSVGGVGGVIVSHGGRGRDACEATLDSYSRRDSSLGGDLVRLLEEIHELKLTLGGDSVASGDIRTRLGWDQETFDGVLAAAKRDSVVYEPKPGFLGVSR